MSGEDTIDVAVRTPEVQQSYKELGLTEDEYRRVRDILGRRPTGAELALYSVMWSEHCSYKSSKVHLRNLAPNADQARYLLAGIGANAGVVDIGQGYAVTFKIESHNHPSFVEPHQGAATGIGGIVRDILAMGARPIAVMDAIRFGPADAGRGALERLDVARVVMRFQLERDRVALADVDDARVLADAGQQRGSARCLLGKLPQVHPGRLVGAVLAPHHRVDRQLGVGGPAAQHPGDPHVLLGGQPELGVGLRPVRRTGRLGDSVLRRRGLRRRRAGRRGHAAARARRADVKKPSPSSPGPVSASIACSGCGIRPTMLPLSLRIPAMPAAEPFGLAPTYRAST